MEEVIKLADNYMYTTTTADVTSPDDFIVEFLTDFHDNDKNDPSTIKINNINELIDFLEKNGMVKLFPSLLNLRAQQGTPGCTGYPKT